MHPFFCKFLHVLAYASSSSFGTLQLLKQSLRYCCCCCSDDDGQADDDVDGFSDGRMGYSRLSLRLHSREGTQLCPLSFFP